MAFVVDEKTGDITLVQGDSGSMVLQGLPTDADYTVYFSFYDENRKIIGQEMQIQSNNSSQVIISIDSSLTDLLKVDKDDDTGEYYYGLKICNPTTGYEDTLCINDGDIGDLNYVIVYPKKVEGIITGQ